MRSGAAVATATKQQATTKIRIDFAMLVIMKARKHLNSDRIFLRRSAEGRVRWPSEK